MSFLSPLFLLGALAIAGPILFHLIRRAARDRVPFSSLMFLRPTPPRVARRRKLEHRVLLLLRCLCLGALAAAFARPFFFKPLPAQAAAVEGIQRAVLVDTSASMRREGLWSQARAIAGRYLERFGAGDQVALLTFDRMPRTLVGFEEWSSWPAGERAALAEQRLDRQELSWMDTHLGEALTAAAELFGSEALSRQAPGRRELIVITDLQEGAKLDGLQGFNWPPGVHVVFERVKSKRRANAGIQVLEDSRPAVRHSGVIRVRVANARESDEERFRIQLSGADATQRAGGPVQVYVPPGQTRTVAIPLPAGVTRGSLRLTGDEADYDNESCFAVPEQESVRIAYFGPELPDDPAHLRFYLERAFSPNSNRRIELVGASEFKPEAFDMIAFAVIPGRLDAGMVRSIRDWVARGKAALVVLTDVDMAETLAGLLGVTQVQLKEVEAGYALLGEIDFRHPLFAPFGDPRFSDFTHIHFWKHRSWELPGGIEAVVPARFDDGSPALMQVAVGEGRLLVLSAGWQPADSQLALSSKFAPLMETLLDWSGAGAPRRHQFQTGDSLVWPDAPGGLVEWQAPDGGGEKGLGAEPFGRTDVPGLYRALAREREEWFAVNLSLEESRTGPMSTDEFARLGVPLVASVDAASAQARSRQREMYARQEEIEGRQKFWRWLIAGVVALIFIETVFSAWLVRRSTSPAAAS